LAEDVSEGLEITTGIRSPIPYFVVYLVTDEAIVVLRSRSRTPPPSALERPCWIVIPAMRT
jgi:hypothetical protein